VQEVCIRQLWFGLERKLEPSAARDDAAGGKLAALHYTWVSYGLCLAKMLLV
jgi:hypothetical protein